MMFSSEWVDDTDWPGKYDIEKIRITGFIAQEVNTAAQEVGYDFNGISRPTSERGLYGLNYTQFVMPLIKAVQEQQAQIEALKLQNVQLGTLSQQNQSLQTQLDEMRAEMQSFRAAIRQQSADSKSGGKK